MTDNEILSALREVRHPGQGDKDLVELGMVQEISAGDNHIKVVLGFPKHRDPLAEYLIGSARASLIRNSPQGTEIEVKAVVREEAPAKKKQNVNDLTLDEINNVRHIIGVASGKGGVGKSTVWGTKSDLQMPMSMALRFL